MKSQLDIQSWGDDIHPQLESLLFRIPTEIRDRILELALTEDILPTPYSNHDFRFRNDHEPDELADKKGIADYLRLSGVFFRPPPGYRPDCWARACEDDDLSQCSFGQPHDHDWFRPSCLGPRTPMAPVLRLCRRIYVELKDNPLATRDIYTFRAREPYLSKDYESRRSPRVRLFTPIWIFSETFMRSTLKDSRLVDVRDLRITIRHRDWWFEAKSTLYINPFRGDEVLTFKPEQAAEMMRRDMDATKDFPGPESIGLNWGPPLKYRHRQWGLAFRNLKQLQTLKMDFEISYSRKEECGRIVEWAARVWRFPLSGNRYLSAEGQTVNETSWRGLGPVVPTDCSQCIAHQDSKPETDSSYTKKSLCMDCDRWRNKQERELGPRYCCWTVTWVVKDTGYEGESQDSLNLVEPKPKARLLAGGVD
jgi:hypothetical protein